MASFDQVADNLRQDDRKVAMAAIHAAEAEIDAQIESQMAAKLAEAEKSLYVGLGFAGLALAFGLILMMYIVRNVIRPLVGMKEYMGLLATGDYSNEVPHADRKDEIGEMAQSVAYFRQGEMDSKCSSQPVREAAG
jgi:HAMP domain-containing protein